VAARQRAEGQGGCCSCSGRSPDAYL